MPPTLRIFLLVVALLPFPAWSADPVEDPAASVPTESQRLGRELLLGMAEFVAGLERFGVTVRGGFDVLQDDGQKLQFLEVRRVTLARPDRFRAEETRSDGLDSVLVFDGARMTIWDAERGVFAQAEQPGSIDDAVLYFVRDLEMRLPLAPLFSTRFPEELGRRLLFVDHVETTYVFDQPAHHIVARTAVVDFQMWISDGAEPWPQRLVITYRGEAGQPQYWAEFDGWTTKPRLGKDHFAFEPPEGARQIVFAVQIPDWTGADAAAATGVQP